MRSADTEVQSKIEICAAVSEIEIPKLDLDTTGKINDLNDLLKGILKEKSPTTKNLRTNHYRNLDVAIPLRFTMSSCAKKMRTQHATITPNNLDTTIALQTTTR